MKIITNYYGKGNLGDDLFLEILADRYKNHEICIIGNARYFKKFRKNVRLLPESVALTLIGKAQSLLSKTPKIVGFLKRIYKRIFERVTKKSKAYILIGGSVFLSDNGGNAVIPFKTEERPDFSLRELEPFKSGQFVIGANLGPAFSEKYWETVRARLSRFGAVSLRDYSSYVKVRDLGNVQYAPDVIFNLEPEIRPCRDHAIISVVKIENHTKDKNKADAYYKLMRDAALGFTERGIKVVFVSFCKAEGDEEAIGKIMKELEDTSMVSTVFYNMENLQEILDIFSSSCFVVASRFHSMILSMVYEKPFFAFSYNCKTENYLNDVEFHGKYASLEGVLDASCDDVMYNFENRTVADCTMHKKYAANQFAALDKYLESIGG